MREGAKESCISMSLIITTTSVFPGILSQRSQTAHHGSKIPDLLDLLSHTKTSCVLHYEHFRIHFSGKEAEDYGLKTGLTQHTAHFRDARGTSPAPALLLGPRLGLRVQSTRQEVSASHQAHLITVL